MHRVEYVFGRRKRHDDYPPNYPFGPTSPLYFVVYVNEKPDSWESAHALLSGYLQDFELVCRATSTNNTAYPIANPSSWIPDRYLETPTIEVDGKELLRNGEQPNPWLSRNSL